MCRVGVQLLWCVVVSTLNLGCPLRWVMIFETPIKLWTRDHRFMLDLVILASRSFLGANFSY